MTSLLATAVCFLILSQWLTQQVTGRLQPVDSCELGMADDAFDDQYEGCTEEMEAKAPQLLKEELEVNRILNEAWEEAKIKWEEIKNKVDSSKLLNDSHGIALVAYTGDISNEFNKAIRNFRQNTNNFQFKAFHYYLTRALQLLLPGEKTCYIVYRGCKTKFDYSGRGNVRFGQFASSSLSKSVAIRFSDYLKGTLFTIKTCLGVKIDKFSFYPLEEEVLIPGYEKYQEVTQNDNYISLMKPQISKSNYNCFYINSSGLSKQSFFHYSEKEQNEIDRLIQQISQLAQDMDRLFSADACPGMKESSGFILLLPGLLVLLFLPTEL